MWITLCVFESSNLDSAGPFHSAPDRASARAAEAASTAHCSAIRTALAKGAMRDTCLAATMHSRGTMIHMAISGRVRHDSIDQSIAVPSSGP